MGLREDFSADFATERFGLVSGSAIAVSFPDVPSKLARFITYGGNATYMYIGRDGNVTWQMAAGVDTGWFPVVGDNLNQMQYKSASGTMDKLAYWVQF